MKTLIMTPNKYLYIVNLKVKIQNPFKNVI